MLYLWYIDYIHVPVIEAKPYLCYFQRILFDSILNKCYAVSYLHIVQLTIETVLSLSEMYYDTFTNRKKYNFLCRRLIKKERQKKYIHAYILSVKRMHTFLA